MLAAHRAGLTSVILPYKNERDPDDLPGVIRQARTFIPVLQINRETAVALASDKQRK